MSQKIIQVDSFTNKPFAGNPAAVCVMSSAADESWMQQVALEMNLSETAFLYPDGYLFQLRWFTPVAEVEMCGHATLASAHVLWEEGHLRHDQTARFITMSGELTAVKKDDWIELNFPATPVTKSTTPEGLIKALGEKPVFIGLNKYDCLAQFASDQAVRDLKPDFGALKRVSVRGMITTAADSTGEYDFISRFFAPAVGIDEDPVTGSAHCALTPFWAERLSKSELTAFQASRRGGVLRLLNDGDRVRLSGQAVTVMRGELV